MSRGAFARGLICVLLLAALGGELAAPANASFGDVSGTSYAPYVEYLARQGVMEGVGGDRFDLDGPVDRATVAAVLYRLAGSPEPPKEPAAGGTQQKERKWTSAFPDVPEGSWYDAPVGWASANGVILGVSGGLFAPKRQLSRSELAVLLYRSAGEPETGTALTDRYRDASAVPKYASDAFTWAVNSGIFAGMIRETLEPALPVNRGQLAQALTAYIAGTEGDSEAAALAANIGKDHEPSRSLANHADIKVAVDRAASKYGADAIQVAVIESGRVTDTFTVGWADKNGVPLTESHKIRTASISKVAVGMAAVLLREEGVVDTETGIGTYWGADVKSPYYPRDTISISAILRHTSTMRDSGAGSQTPSYLRSYLTRAAGYNGKRPGVIGSWEYSNFAFGILGMTLEHASGENLDDVLDRRLFNYLGIDAAFEAGALKHPELTAQLYRDAGEVGLSAEKARSFVPSDPPGQYGKYFAGGLTVSAADLAKLIAVLAGDGTYCGVRLMEASSVTYMESYDPVRTSKGFWQARPMRYNRNLFGRAGMYYHTGSAYGVYNLAAYDPDTGDGVVVLTVGARQTYGEGGIYAVCADIARAVMDEIAR